MSLIPEDLKYSKTHEWVRVENGIAVIGITDHAQSELGDVVYLSLPEVGRILKYDEPFGEVESVKAVSELYSPVSGEVVEVNTAIIDSTEVINEDPFGRGWLIKVEMSDPSELDRLMDASAYAKYCEES
ncbi:glycine cleavage system H protein [Chthonomonas calidirosea]|uniref:Glycine cleavage system H protein n=1 Tax=Chthonomonas calidirosea (strain DSM 23976 / ICMP 18418 / T49) TaxID=1303518 RepID=S0ESM5_CHTCT|nr:glycine cleavage system protein GcvH [Chthonomonas calidirosea]CCW34259.1 glycine cleavage system H protein [Chthonomonas calidirosea T49]CEK14121.1 glycine cleavage system H protein [Chthonomonas calidirosea]CEK14122.1 glycine cleavage system H protein [Chthonomonas calidirosea]CEK15296.1 glycine cleavage system H protein [Chthonomonas calidirosea]